MQAPGQPFLTIDNNGNPLKRDVLYCHPTRGCLQIVREVSVRAGANQRDYCRVFYQRPGDAEEGPSFVAHSIRGLFRSPLVLVNDNQ